MNTYNPDVLQCLANLSNDEVFTPPQLANEVLDLLPKEIWSDPNIKFLDPCCKTGVFLREITIRLLKGLEDQIPDLQERINHILTHQVYGIAITELTALTTRRTLYCSKEANGEYSVCTTFGNSGGNIYYNSYIHHIWDEKTCTICGASKKKYNRPIELETHAYAFIHKPIEELFNMKFDVIIGNPPYQLNDGGGTGDSAKPIYNKFIEQAKKLNPKYISMIIPSRWMKGGKGLDKFRQEMIEDKRISYLYDFANSKECFPTNNIDGGICYFLWDANHNGVCQFYHKALDGYVDCSTRYLNNGLTASVIRDSRQNSIIKKTSVSEKRFSDIVSAQKPYGFRADFFNDREKYKDIPISSYKTDDNQICIHGVKGKKGGAKRTKGFINEDSVKKNRECIEGFKLFFSKAYMATSTVPPEIIFAGKNEICTETFLQIGFFETSYECENCLSYIKTKFFRSLLFFNRHSLNISQSSFDLIPLEDFSKPWTDDELYKKYGLTQEEIDYIETMIHPMNTKGEK